jgi:hypothetical protein
MKHGARPTGLVGRAHSLLRAEYNYAKLQNRQNRRPNLETPFLGRVFPEARHACQRTGDMPQDALWLRPRQGQVRPCNGIQWFPSRNTALLRGRMHARQRPLRTDKPRGDQCDLPSIPTWNQPRKWYSLRNEHALHQLRQGADSGGNQESRHFLRLSRHPGRTILQRGRSQARQTPNARSNHQLQPGKVQIGKTIRKRQALTLKKAVDIVTPVNWLNKA